MKVLDYLFVTCLTVIFTFATNSVAAQSVDLFFSSNNTCQEELEVGIFIRASQFSAFDFEIGSTSIFVDFDPKVVHYASYIENEFSVNMSVSNGWLPHQLSYDNECGMLNLVLELEDPAMNKIYLSRQQAIKIGTLKFSIIDPVTDPLIAVRPEFSSVYGAGSNDGTTPIPILNIPQVLDYSCVEDCDLPPTIYSLDVIDENCFEDVGGFELYIADNPDRDSVEISINGGFNYDYIAAVNRNYSIQDLASGYYDLWLRWKNDQCPTPLGNYYIGSEGGPNVTVSVKNNCDQNVTASIVFEYPDQLPTINSLKFSINGGSSFSPIVADNTGSYTFDDVDIGQYDCVVSWGDGTCLTNLGVINVTPPDFPTLSVRQYGHCYSRQPLNGSLFFDIVDNPAYDQLLISVDDGVSFPYLLNDNIGTFAIHNFRAESFVIRAKYPSGQCSYYYGSGFFRYVPRAFDMGIDYSPQVCENLHDGTINIVINMYENPKPSVSIDGGENFSFSTNGQNQYLFENLGPGDYPIYLSWGDCIEYHSLVVIGEKSDCPSCFDGIKNGDELYVDCGGSYCAPCDECQINLALNANYIEDNILFRASDYIEIKGTIDEDLSVVLQAEEEILLKPHFEVSINTVFHAYIEDCN